jgi:hypothetical protein
MMLRFKTIRSALIGGLCAMAVPTLGCIAAPVVPPLGMVYTDIHAPLAPRGDVGTRRGTSQVTSILGLISIGDASVKAAAANGNIRDVKLVDYAYTNVLLIFQRYTTIAYGD